MKNEWPNASTIAEAVKSSNLGLNRKDNPSIPPSNVIPLIAKTPNKTIIIGIIILDHFSIPPFTPWTITNIHKPMNKIW